MLQVMEHMPSICKTQSLVPGIVDFHYEFHLCDPNNAGSEQRPVLLGEEVMWVASTTLEH